MSKHIALRFLILGYLTKSVSMQPLYVLLVVTGLMTY